MGLGDDLMWLGEAARVHKHNKDAVIHDGRELSEMWNGHDWIVAPDYNGPKKKMLVPRKPNGNRWYIDGWAPGRIIYKNYKPIPAPYRIATSELNEAARILKHHGITPGEKFVVINPDTKNTTLASNKDWGFKKWQALADLLAPHIKVLRIKPSSPVNDVSGHVAYDKKHINNAVNVQVDNVRIAFAMMAGSACIVTSEGGVHHFAAAINKPAFVLYGGVIHPDQTGYDDRDQTYYVYDHPDTPCGSQVECSHCREAMDMIDPKMIADDVLEYINQ